MINQPKSLIKINGKSLLEGATLDLLENHVKKYYLLNKEIIDKYLYLRDKVEEFKMRINPPYKLYILNNKSSGKVINAKIKIASSENGNITFNYYNIHIGKLEQYKLGLTDPQLEIDVKKKIKNFLNLKFPAILYDIDNQQINLKY